MWAGQALTQTRARRRGGEARRPGEARRLGPRAQRLRDPPVQARRAECKKAWANLSERQGKSGAGRKTEAVAYGCAPREPSVAHTGLAAENG
eukprot:4899775-Lingulodinium_polyedra.AAC.1